MNEAKRSGSLQSPGPARVRKKGSFSYVSALGAPDPGRPSIGDLLFGRPIRTFPLMKFKIFIESSEKDDSGNANNHRSVEFRHQSELNRQLDQTKRGDKT